MKSKRETLQGNRERLGSILLIAEVLSNICHQSPHLWCRYLVGKNKIMSTLAIIAFAVVILHLLVGFGYVAYKLRPLGKEEEQKE